MTRPVTLDQPALDRMLLAEESVPGDFVMIEVSDTGVGIAREAMSRLFDPFFTTKFTGRGLGLPAVAGIVRGQRGALRVESTPGRGSVFQVYLPLNTTPAPSFQHTPPLFTSRSSNPPIPSDMGSVLIADDDDVVRALAKWIVERAGFRAVTARDGDEALAQFRRDPRAFRLVLLDFTMPRMSGDEVLAGLRAHRPDIPVVIITGHAADVMLRGDRLGLAGYLQKPFSPEELRAVLQRYVPEGVKV
jgi:CheY-like chemotaxis protein